MPTTRDPAAPGRSPPDGRRRAPGEAGRGFGCPAAKALENEGVDTVFTPC